MGESIDDFFQIGEVLEKQLTEIEEKLEDQINKIIDLSHIGAVFTSLLDLDMILPMVIETALRIVKGEVGEIIIFDSGEQPKTASWGLSYENIQKIKTQQGVNIIDHVRNTGESITINNLSFHDNDKVRVHQVSINSIISTPLKAQDKVVGVVTIANKEDGQEFDEDDRFSLELLGSFAAVAVMNVELHEEALIKQKIEHELDIAEHVQQTLMPQENVEYDGIDVNVYHHQAGQVGGDFYDIVKLEDGKYLAIVADVSNKGMPAALIMTAARSYIHILAEDISSLSEFVAKFNEFLCRDMQRMGGMFITMFFGLFDLKENILLSVNAGHPPGYLFRGDEVIKLKTGGPFVGQFSGIKYIENKTPLKTGDKLIVYTDGIFESVNSKGEMLGLANSLKFLKKHCHAPWHDFVNDLKILLKEYSYDVGYVDDTTLMHIEVKK
ncbi:MAG: SpoIIE family protein phosphatase [candidate division Zixibacteria bacterium]|nr:SpoIIE family protein phosphatase [candidate division Zixibacteria bacterium]